MTQCSETTLDLFLSFRGPTRGQLCYCSHTLVCHLCGSTHKAADTKPIINSIKLLEPACSHTLVCHLCSSRHRRAPSETYFPCDNAKWQLVPLFRCLVKMPAERCQNQYNVAAHLFVADAAADMDSPHQIALSMPLKQIWATCRWPWLHQRPT